MDIQEKIRLIVNKTTDYGVYCYLSGYHSKANDEELMNKYSKEKELIISGLIDFLEDIL